MLVDNAAATLLQPPVLVDVPVPQRSASSGTGAALGVALVAAVLGVLGRRTPDTGVEEMPLLLLNFACVPGTELCLPVREAHRQLFDDVMQSGPRRIAVCMDRPESDTMEDDSEESSARVGVVFEVKNFDFSANTEDGNRYLVAQCSVVGRVRIRKVARGGAPSSRAYRRVEVEPYEDLDRAPCDTSDLELQAKAALQRVVALQGKDDQLGLPEGVPTESTFTRDGLWKFVELWQDVEILRVFEKCEQLREKRERHYEESRMLEDYSRQDGVPAEVLNYIDAVLNSRSHAERLRIFIDLFEVAENTLAIQAAYKIVKIQYA
jgi:Lon protease-like protein